MYHYVFNLEATQLKEDLDWKIENVSYTTLTSSFQQWNETMLGYAAPER